MYRTNYGDTRIVVANTLPAVTRQRAMTIRLSPRTYEAVSAAAQAAGVPIATYMREATMIRAAYEMGVTTGIGFTEVPDPAILGPIRQAVLDATREFLAGEAQNAEQARQSED